MYVTVDIHHAQFANHRNVNKKEKVRMGKLDRLKEKAKEHLDPDEEVIQGIMGSY